MLPTCTTLIGNIQASDHLVVHLNPVKNDIECSADLGVVQGDTAPKPFPMKFLNKVDNLCIIGSLLGMRSGRRLNWVLI